MLQRQIFALTGAWAEILWYTIPVLYQLSLKVNPPAKASIDDSTTLIQVHDTYIVTLYYHGYEFLTSTISRFLFFVIKFIFIYWYYNPLL